MFNASSAKRAQFYRQLAGLEHAGIPIRQALAKVRVSSPDLRRVKAHLQQAVERGEDLGVACGQTLDLGPFERQMIVASNRVGRLSDAWRELAGHFEARAAAKGEMISQLTYPVIVLHVAVFLPPLYVWMKEGLDAYLKVTLLPYAIVVGAVAGLVMLARLLQGGALLDALLWHLPLRPGIYRLHVRRTTLSVLRSSLGAGLIASAAFDAAAEACPGVLMRRSLVRAAQEAKSGTPLPAIVDQLTLLPTSVRDGMVSGAESGSLPETLARLETIMAEEARVRQKVALTLFGVLAFLAVAAVVGYKVVTFFKSTYEGPLFKS